MAGLHRRQGRTEPLTALRRKMWGNPHEIHLVLVTRCLGFVEQLDLWRKVRKAIVWPAPNGRQRAANARVPPEQPVLTLAVRQHELHAPRLTGFRATPDIVDAGIELIPLVPRAKGPVFWAWLGQCRLYVPASESCTHHLLIMAEDLDIEISMVPRLSA